jgi:hypothetical protein
VRKTLNDKSPLEDFLQTKCQRGYGKPVARRQVGGCQHEAGLLREITGYARNRR